MSAKRNLQYKDYEFRFNQLLDIFEVIDLLEDPDYELVLRKGEQIRIITQHKWALLWKLRWHIRNAIGATRYALKRQIKWLTKTLEDDDDDE